LSFTAHLVVQFLVEKGANIEASDNRGLTALHVSAAAGFAQTVSYLVRGKKSTFL
jgi:ankyrin repeat protein